MSQDLLRLQHRQEVQAKQLVLSKPYFRDSGTALTTSVIPALGAIAVPAAVAVAAIVGFVAAVETIRANLAIFDQLGVAIGNTFPQLKPLLDDARQAFINFSDGLNTGISMLLGVFDSLTGGVLGAQKAWDGFTGTLPKGTGEMGLAANAANLWTLAMDKSGNVIRVGAGKWKEADGVLLRLNGSVPSSKRYLGSVSRRYCRLSKVC